MFPQKRRYEYKIYPHNGYVSIEYTAKNGFGVSVRNDFVCMCLNDIPIRTNGDDVVEVSNDLTLTLSPLVVAIAKHTLGSVQPPHEAESYTIVVRECGRLMFCYRFSC